ncbi:MAG: hypothetical protein ABR500_05070 [Dermatophilaceae bacterium]|nr:hypothetical protein [Intrasporangiaceae bacterium]
MVGLDRECAGATLLTVLMVGLIGALAWLGVHTGHLAPGPAAASEPGSATTTAPRATTPPTRASPTTPSTLTVVPPDPALAAAFADRTARLGGQYALAWVDADGLHVLGSPPGETAWSTIKVPLAIAAATEVPDDGTWQQIGAAITRSDNAAALALWTALGPPEEAASDVDKVLDAYGSPEARTEHADVRPPFSAFGQTQWSNQSQARFASDVMCEPDSSPAGRVRAEMSRVALDQRWGIGALESAHLKGGWGPEPDGAYVLRQLGDGQVAGQRYALGLSARSATGSYADATIEATTLVQWWARTVAPDAPGLTCPES